jgi:hypothetical protein
MPPDRAISSFSYYREAPEHYTSSCCNAFCIVVKDEYNIVLNADADQAFTKFTRLPVPENG